VKKTTKTFISTSPEETMAWAMAWAHRLPAGTVIALHGDLGAGKTCLVQGLARGLDTQGGAHSPTFTLVNEYSGGRLPLYHLDLYRLRGEADALEIGIDQYLPGDGVTAIEWADRIEGLLPAATIRVVIEHGDRPDQRRIMITPPEAL
jgi:tRNA threonylcarbamoyladenosine biosynthesis protein TsaE